jgi:hypothetical protein
VNSCAASMPSGTSTVTSRPSGVEIWIVSPPAHPSGHTTCRNAWPVSVSTAALRTISHVRIKLKALMRMNARKRTNRHLDLLMRLRRVVQPLRDVDLEQLPLAHARWHLQVLIRPHPAAAATNGCLTNGCLTNASVPWCHEYSLCVYAHYHHHRYAPCPRIYLSIIYLLFVHPLVSLQLFTHAFDGRQQPLRHHICWAE